MTLEFFDGCKAAEFKESKWMKPQATALAFSAIKLSDKFRATLELTKKFANVYFVHDAHPRFFRLKTDGSFGISMPPESAFHTTGMANAVCLHELGHCLGWLVGGEYCDIVKEEMAATITAIELGKRYGFFVSHEILRAAFSSYLHEYDYSEHDLSCAIANYEESIRQSVNNRLDYAFSVLATNAALDRALAGVKK